MTKIQLSKTKYTIIDDEDYDRVSRYNWSYNSGYARCLSRNIYLHRLILNPPNDKQIDHINHNTLDNRKNNLRICSGAENCKNTNSHKDSVSRFKGVCFDKQTKKWQSQIYINGYQVKIGRFDNEIDAARAYDDLASEHFGEFAKFNLR